MKIVTFGEILLRLAAPGYTRILQKDSFDTSFCGGEANVAVSLANFGLDSFFVTKLPSNEIGYAAQRSLRYFNVNTSYIIFDDGRMGLYYLEKGASQRPSKIIYDRQNSSISNAMVDDFDWDKIFEGASWFHFTGITPALSDTLIDICHLACVKAKQKSLTVSCDLNFRAKLWSKEKARSVMSKYMPFIDVCICNEEDAQNVLGIYSNNTDVENANLVYSDYEEAAKKIYELYGCNYVSMTLRKSYSASRNGWSAILFDAKSLQCHRSKEYDIQLVDRVGGGDSFAAGLIYALSNNYDAQKAVDFAVASSCLKQTMEGDYNRASIEEVINLVNSSGNGRIQR